MGSTDVVCRGLFEDVLKILESGNALYVNAMKNSIRAYLHCIEKERQREKEIFDIEKRINDLEREMKLEEKIKKAIASGGRKKTAGQVVNFQRRSEL